MNFIANIRLFEASKASKLFAVCLFLFYPTLHAMTCQELMSPAPNQFEKFQELFKSDLATMVKKGVISQNDLKKGRASKGRVRNTDKTVFVFEGAPTYELIEGTNIRTEKRNVFLLAEEPRVLFPSLSWLKSKLSNRWVSIDDLPRPQDRHEIIFDLEDGRVLIAFEFYTGLTESTPSDFFLRGSEFGPDAIKSLIAESSPFYSKFFKDFAGDIQVLMNHIFRLYSKKVVEKSKLFKTRSQKTGTEIYFLEISTEDFGVHYLFFAKNLIDVALEPELKPHQVTREYDLQGLDMSTQGILFDVLESPENLAKVKTLQITTKADKFIFTVK